MNLVPLHNLCAKSIFLKSIIGSLIFNFNSCGGYPLKIIKFYISRFQNILFEDIFTW
jgi:hypothetical protein